MAAVQVEAARIPDRDRMVGELREQGLDARPVEELGIEVRCGDDAKSACAEVLGQVEGMILSIGAPFVPLEHEGTIYIRPPIS